MHSWLDAYGRAWETRDPEAAAQLFTDEASYQWGPFEQPLRGREAIRDRWAHATGTQDEVRFGHETLAVTEDKAIARWWASFIRRAQASRVRLEGIFVLSLTEDGCCSEFREWWNAEETPV